MQVLTQSAIRADGERRLNGTTITLGVKTFSISTAIRRRYS